MLQRCRDKVGDLGLQPADWCPPASHCSLDTRPLLPATRSECAPPAFGPTPVQAIPGPSGTRALRVTWLKPAACKATAYQVIAAAPSAPVVTLTTTRVRARAGWLPGKYACGQARLPSCSCMHLVCPPPLPAAHRHPLVPRRHPALRPDAGHRGPRAQRAQRLERVQRPHRRHRAAMPTCAPAQVLLGGEGRRGRG